jgi:hypothetical protein
MKSLRKQALEDYTKDVEMGLPFAEDYIDKSSNVERNALKARNLSEDALAQRVLKNTGVSIPDDRASLRDKESFLSKLLEEQYPEVKAGVRVLPQDKILELDPENPSGWYNSKSGILEKKPQIIINENQFKDGPIKAAATAFHEGGHGYDDVMKLGDTKELDIETLRQLKKQGLDLNNMDPAELYELYGAKHHAKIPKLREGTFGLGALKSYLKSGTFKALPVVGTAAAAAAALSSPDASAAVGDFVMPGGLESLGPSVEDVAIENPQANSELRRKALEALTQK